VLLILTLSRRRDYEKVLTPKPACIDNNLRETVHQVALYVQQHYSSRNSTNLRKDGSEYLQPVQKKKG